MAHRTQVAAGIQAVGTQVADNRAAGTQVVGIRAVRMAAESQDTAGRAVARPEGHTQMHYIDPMCPAAHIRRQHRREAVGIFVDARRALRRLTVPRSRGRPSDVFQS